LKEEVSEIIWEPLFKVFSGIVWYHLQGSEFSRLLCILMSFLNTYAWYAKFHYCYIAQLCYYEGTVNQTRCVSLQPM